MIKYEDNPPMLPASVSSVRELVGEWWVAHTKPRCEKAFAFDLLARSVGFFLPMTETVMKSGGRNRRVLLPLFTSYVFFCGEQQSRIDAFETGRVVQVLPVKHREKFVDELHAVERALSLKGRLELYPCAAVGQRCRIRGGPMGGIEGVIVQVGERSQLVLQVSMLGCGAALEIEPGLVEPIE